MTPVQVTEVPSTPVDAARALAYASQKAYDDGNYEEARAAASAAQRLVAAPTLALLEARALKKLGRYREAQTQYRWASAPLAPGASDAFHIAQASAQAELLTLEDEMPHVYLALRGTRSADVEASLDGLDLPTAALAVWLPVDPGVHEIRVEVGGVSERHRVSLDPGDRERIWVGSGTPVAAFDPRVPVGVTALGVGAVALGAGIGFTIRANDLNRELELECPRDRCPPGVSNDLSEFHTMRDLATASYVLGAVGVVTGSVVLWALPRNEPDDATLAATWGPNRVALEGTF